MLASLMPCGDLPFGVTDSIRAVLRREESMRQSMQEAMRGAGVMDAIHYQRRLLDDLRSSSQLTEVLRNEMVDLHTLGETLTAPYRALHDIMRSQGAIFERLSDQVTMLNATALNSSRGIQDMFTWNVASIGLATRMNEIGLSAQREMLSARLFEVPNTYAAFAQRTVERFASNPSQEVCVRLGASLDLAERQMLGISEALRDFIVVPDDDERPSEIRILNAPFVQQDELLACHGVADGNDSEAIMKASTSMRIVQLARRVLKLVNQCNEAGRVSVSCAEIFRPTTRLMEVYSDLPWIVATDQCRFADVVDCLYFIFYEGAGKDNLRFLDKHGGPLTNTDCELVWHIKRLRNKWTRHDADHGKEADIQKSRHELAATFRYLGLGEYPTDSYHFQQLHERLLVLAEQLLMHILSQLTLHE
jgi:hypothetical protein